MVKTSQIVSSQQDPFHSTKKNTVPNIPTNISTYVEPFGGMFGIFFALDFTKYKDVNFIYNDKNNLNYLLFKNLQSDDFIDLIKSNVFKLNHLY